jgi:hypothetical protein
MNYKDVIRFQPELRFTNAHNISYRMLELTKGDIFVAYNVIRGVHEVHSVENYKLSGMSFNVSLDREMINGFLLNDYKLNNLKMFVKEVQDRREKTNYRLEEAESKRFDQNTALDVVERTLGTKV